MHIESVHERRVALYIRLMKQTGVVGAVIYFIGFFLILNPKTMGDAPVLIILMVMSFLAWTTYERKAIKNGDRDTPEPEKIKRLLSKKYNSNLVGVNGGGVYLLKCGDWIKIGHSSDFYRRIKSLSTSSPYPLEVIYTYQTNDAKTIETALHNKYRDKRGTGEWFALSEKDIEEIKQLLS